MNKTFRDLKITREEASLVLSNPYRETDILGEKRGYRFWSLFLRTCRPREFVTSYERIEYIVTRAAIVRDKR